MKVSVLVPIYRTNERNLREAIESVLNQTFPDFELLLLDDCPTDTREEVVKSYHDARIVYLKNDTNLGISATRNKLLKQAKGEYIAVLDHDDIALPTRLEEQVKYLEDHPEVGVVGSWTEEFPKRRVVRWPEKHEAIVARLTQGCAIPHTGAMIRRSVLQGLEYEETFSPAEDYALWYRLIGKTFFYNIPKVLTEYRIYEGNTTRRTFDKMQRAAEVIRVLFAKEHPELWREIKEKSTYLVRPKLFGFLPLGKFVQQGEKRRGILRFLPFVICKTKIMEGV